MIQRFAETSPTLGWDVFVAPTATVIGDVSLGDRSSVWYGCVLRGDVERIAIGAETNIQDVSVVHVTGSGFPARIGDRVTVGHRAVIHGCTVDDECLIGIGAIILDGVHVGARSIVAAGSVLPPGKVYAPESMIVGAPGQVRRSLTAEEIAGIARSAARYVALAAAHAGLGGSI